MVLLYKKQILPHLEYGTLAVYHAPRLFLGRIDQVQEEFLDTFDVSAREALRQLRLVPLDARRDIAMLGLIHRCVLGIGPAQFVDFFAPMRAPHFPRNCRSTRLLQNRKLHDPIDGFASNALVHSANDRSSH